MLGYALRRVVLVVPTLFAVAVMVFVLSRAAPGSPFDRNDNRPLPREAIERLERAYGIDRPLHEQFALFLSGVVRLDLGTSLVRDRSVAEIVGEGLPRSALLGALAMGLALLVALPLGVVSALSHRGLVDRASLLLVTVGTTIPSFVIGIFAIYLFAVHLRVVPIVGWGTPQHLILPTIILALGPAAFLTRVVRASMLEALTEEHIRTARAKGLSERVVIVRHALRTALIPAVTVIGPATAALVTGSIVVEGLFSVPGIGRLFLQSIVQRDYPVIMGVYLLYALLIAVANLLVDLAYAALDPRIALARR